MVWASHLASYHPAMPTVQRTSSRFGRAPFTCFAMTLLALLGCGSNASDGDSWESSLRCLGVLPTGSGEFQSGDVTRSVRFVGESLFTLSSCVQEWDPLTGEELLPEGVELKHSRTSGGDILQVSKQHGFLGMNQGGRFYAGVAPAGEAFQSKGKAYHKMAFVDGMDAFAAYNKEAVFLYGRATHELRSEQPIAQGIQCVVGGTDSYATALLDHSIVLWPCSEGRSDMVLKGHGAPAVQMAYSSDESALASVDTKGVLILWSLETGDERLRLSLPMSSAVPAAALVFTPDGTMLIGNGKGNIVTFWSTETGEVLHELSVPGGGVLDLDVNPTGDLLAVGTAFKGRFDPNAARKIASSYQDQHELTSGPAFVYDLTSL